MKEILCIISIAAFSLFSCNKQCICKLWTNGVQGSDYTVALESDGSVCSDYSTINVKDTLWDGIECKK